MNPNNINVLSERLSVIVPDISSLTCAFDIDMQDLADCLPNEQLVTILPLEAELMQDMPSEAVTLLGHLLSREIGPMKFRGLIEEIQLKIDKPVKLTI